jgi:hypothetical protein
LLIPFYFVLIRIIFAQVDGVRPGVETSCLEKMNMGVYQSRHYPPAGPVDHPGSGRNPDPVGRTCLLDGIVPEYDGIIGKGPLGIYIQEIGVDDISLCVRRKGQQGQGQEEEGSGSHETYFIVRMKLKYK